MIQELEQTELIEKKNFGQVNYDNLELQLKKEQAEYKKGLSHNFILEVNEFLENCFLTPKNKKENFITREKLALNLYKLIRKQKRFKTPQNIFGEIQYLAVYDKETNDICKLININFIERTVEFISYHDRQNDYTNKTKHFRDIYLFDYNSPQMDAMYNHHIRAHNRGLSFIDMVHFLERNDFTKIDEVEFPKGFGVEVAKAEETPIIKEVMLEYKIPENQIVKQKRRLQKLDATTLSLIEDFASVKEAEEKTKISASTISNVLCQGTSAVKYIEAGGFKWQYSNEPNLKYITKVV